MLRPFQLLLLPLFLLLLLIGHGSAFRLQGVGVKGTLLCKGSYSVHTNGADSMIVVNDACEFSGHL